MLKQSAARCALGCVLVMAPATPALAQQTLNFSLGGFFPRGEEARVNDDWLLENRTYLTFDIDDFDGGTIGAEWLIPFGDFFEGGAGLLYYQDTVPSVYTDFIDNDGTEIDQDLTLRIVPISFSVRVLPLGRSSGVQPYLGAGLGIFNWRYTETGEFIDFTQGDVIFRSRFASSGTEVGPIALGGIRFASDRVSVGGEVRYQSASDDLGSEFDPGTFDPQIDLGGWTYLFNVGVRFGR